VAAPGFYPILDAWQDRRRSAPTAEMVAYAKSLAGNKKVKLPPGFAGIDTPDPLTVVFRLQWPDAAMLANFASPWNCVYSAAKLAQDPNFPNPSCLSSTSRGRSGAAVAGRRPDDGRGACRLRSEPKLPRRHVHLLPQRLSRERPSRKRLQHRWRVCRDAVNNINTLASSRTR